MRPLTTLRFSPIVLLTYIVLFMIPEVVQFNTTLVGSHSGHNIQLGTLHDSSVGILPYSQYGR